MRSNMGLAVSLFLAGACCLADEPAKQKEEGTSGPAARKQNPPPPEFPPPPQVHATGNLFLPVVPVYAPPEHGKLSVWQLYGVDSSGRFRPRVIYSPQGAYYLYNFAPYPWTSINRGQYMPYAVD